MRLATFNLGGADECGPAVVSHQLRTVESVGATRHTKFGLGRCSLPTRASRLRGAARLLRLLETNDAQRR